MDLSEDEPKEFIGLENTANQCYLNSVLQLLYLTPEFRNAVFKWVIVKDVKYIDDNIGKELQRLFSQLKLSKKEFLTTRRFVKAFIYLRSGAQQDINEFITLLFNSIQKFVHLHKLENIVKKLYRGTMAVHIKCLSCKDTNITKQKFFDINLVLKGDDGKTFGTIQEAFDKFLQPEYLTGDNKYQCSKCDKKCDAKKRQKLYKLPYILHVLLTRLEYDRIQQKLVKINDRVEYPERLKLSDTKGQHEYELFGVILHGGTPLGGHYTAILKDFNTQSWCRFNDITITRMTQDAYKMGFGQKQGYPSAYMLAYRKVNSLKNERFLEISDLSDLSQKIIMNHLFSSRELIMTFDVFFEGPNKTLLSKKFYVNADYSVRFARFYFHLYFLGLWTKASEKYQLSIYDQATGSADILTDMEAKLNSLYKHPALILRKEKMSSSDRKEKVEKNDDTPVSYAYQPIPITVPSENLNFDEYNLIPFEEDEIVTPHTEEPTKQTDLENQTVARYEPNITTEEQPTTEIGDGQVLYIVDGEVPIDGEFIVVGEYQIGGQPEEEEPLAVKAVENLMLTTSVDRTFVLDLYTFSSSNELIQGIYSRLTVSIITNFTIRRGLDIILKESDLLKVADRELYKALRGIPTLKIKRMDISAEDPGRTRIPFIRRLKPPPKIVYIIWNIVRIGGQIHMMFIELTGKSPEISHF